MTTIWERGQFLHDKIEDWVMNHVPGTKVPDDLAQGAAAWLLYNFTEIKKGEQ